MVTLSISLFWETAKEANIPAAWPIWITTGWSLVVPLTRFETEIDFSITIKLLMFSGIKLPNGTEYEGIG